jgi:MFS family permease
LSATPLPKGAWYALAIVGLTQTMSLLDRQILAILAPAIKADLKIGDAEMGLLFGTVFALFYALFSLPLGRLADGWTRTKLLSICLVFWSLATGLAGFASSFAMLALSRLGVGIGDCARHRGLAGVGRSGGGLVGRDLCWLVAKGLAVRLPRCRRAGLSPRYCAVVPARARAGTYGRHSHAA